MSSLGIVPIMLLVLILIWTGTLTYFLFKSIRHYNTLIKSADRKTLSSTLEQLLSQTHTNQTTLTHLDTRLKQQEKQSEFYIQKVGLMRYNPFADTGGEQSFVVSLLDNNNSGMILTSLQGRSGTRWYAKHVKDGKGVEFDLSKEEDEAVRKARKLT